ncbi:deoxynucleoside kinase [Effusibacillus consociatus]|uniref:Deoxynucleoside kinase n=1 Tax=Effusibacillus consociatus TaxID=1117041 RepID=A0ABV9Q353_9BACL
MGGSRVKPHFITVEGPIGIGKTSLAEAISERFGFVLLKEIVEENPFLGKFYENIEEWSFQTEMFFLCNRYKQLRDIESRHLLAGQSVVADYNIFKNTIFARRTLSGSELAKYLTIYDILTADMPQASLIVYLNASVDTIMSRIAKRGRPFEKNIEKEYIRVLQHDYNNFFDSFKKTHPTVPVIDINGDEVDFVERESDLEAVLMRIQHDLS